MKLGAIADDFTGATDLADVLARSGLQVSLRLGVPEDPPGNSAAFEVIALKTRTAPISEAVSQARAALDWLRQAGCDRFFWKYCSTFDSTPKGNIGLVAEALMADLGAAQAIYCPAFPENGRTVFIGNLFVGEDPLAESSMRNHPLTPMRDSNLMRLLTPQVTKPVGLATRPTVAQGAKVLRERFDALAAEGVAHVIVDAVASEDLRVIAGACRGMRLVTGGSAVAQPLSELWLSERLIATNAETTTRPELPEQAVILSGSCSVMTNSQVATWIARGGPAYQLDPLALSEDGPGKALNWLADQPSNVTPIIYATADPASVIAVQDKLGVSAAGEIVEGALAACAVAARDRGVRRFVIAGGETSGAVVKALGITQLSVAAEILPGVPWCVAQSAGHHIAITLKSGNFGEETFFADALTVLDP